jgi:hypothetical protein
MANSMYTVPSRKARMIKKVHKMVWRLVTLVVVVRYFEGVREEQKRK